MTELHNTRTPILKMPHKSSGEVKNLPMSIFKGLRQELERRNSLGQINSNQSHSHTPPASRSLTGSIQPPSPIQLSIKLESPPVVLYGTFEESTGSILSGLLFMNNNSDVEIQSVTLALEQTIHLTKPFVISSNTVSLCPDCRVRKNVLARWDIVTHSTQFSKGSHAYPFSHLLPGSLPALSKFGSKQSSSFVKYDLVAHATAADGAPLTLTLPVNIARLILRGPDRNSLRVFPPTDISATAVLPNVVYPKSSFPVELKFDNMVSGDRRWRMRKLLWRIEENTRIKGFCCSKHISKLKQSEELQKRSKAPPKPKSGNTHHSTVHTFSTLSPDVSDDVRDNLNRTGNEASGLNGAPIVNVDMTEVERTAPSHAEQSFIEDFSSSVASSIPSSTLGNSVTNSSMVSASPITIASPTIPVNAGAHELRLYLSESRTVSHGEIKSGWKSDFSGSGQIEVVAHINAMELYTGIVKPIQHASSDDSGYDDITQGLRNGANICCDIDDPNEGIFVSHLLVVEVVIAEEVVNRRGKKRNGSEAGSGQAISEPQTSATPTGSARVLRMQFKLTVSERSGLGISWDDEVPPTYNDVSCLSPPGYEVSTTPSSGILGHLTNSNVLEGVGDTPSLDHFALDGGIQDFSL